MTADVNVAPPVPLLTPLLSILPTLFLLVEYSRLSYSASLIYAKCIFICAKSFVLFEETIPSLAFSLQETPSARGFLLRVLFLR